MHRCRQAGKAQTRQSHVVPCFSFPAASLRAAGFPLPTLPLLCHRNKREQSPGKSVSGHIARNQPPSRENAEERKQQNMKQAEKVSQKHIERNTVTYTKTDADGHIAESRRLGRNKRSRIETPCSCQQASFADWPGGTLDFQCGWPDPPCASGWAVGRQLSE